MQLSLHADYACRVLIYLSTMAAEISSVDEIAAAFQVSPNHLVKVVHRLGKLGFIETLRGRGGGIRLARPPAEINLGQVIRQTESNFKVVECFDPANNTCPIIGVCGLMSVLADATEAFLARLDKVTLADVIKHRQKIAAALGSG